MNRDTTNIWETLSNVSPYKRIGLYIQWTRIAVFFFGPSTTFLTRVAMMVMFVGFTWVFKPTINIPEIRWIKTKTEKYISKIYSFEILKYATISTHFFFNYLSGRLCSFDFQLGMSSLILLALGEECCSRLPLCFSVSSSTAEFCIFSIHWITSSLIPHPPTCPE